MTNEYFKKTLADLIEFYGDKRPLEFLQDFFWNKWRFDHITDKIIEETLSLIYEQIHPKYGQGIPADDIQYTLNNILKREKNKKNEKNYDLKYEKNPISLGKMLRLCWEVAIEKKKDEADIGKIISNYTGKFINLWNTSTKKDYETKVIFCKTIKQIDIELSKSVWSVINV